jgi:hypothetical protein
MSKATPSLADRLAARSADAHMGRTCGVSKVIAALKPDDRVDVLECLARSNEKAPGFVLPRVLVEYIATLGHDVSIDDIRRHRSSDKCKTCRRAGYVA